MKNIVLAIQKEAEYLDEKLNRGNHLANIYDYLGVAGYDNLDEYAYDKFCYNIRNLEIVSETDSATVLQPLAYTCYQEAVPFCFFVEYDKPFALVPMGFSDEDKYAEHGLDCFKCGYDGNGGIIITHNDDFRFCISVPSEKNYDHLFLERFLNDMRKYYPDVYVDGNDIMYEGKKVGGSVCFSYNGMTVFAVNISLVDMSEKINELGIVKVKQPGCLPHVEGVKDLLKEEIEGWLSL